MAGGTVKQLVTREMLGNGRRTYTNQQAVDICLQMARGLRWVMSAKDLIECGILGETQRCKVCCGVVTQAVRLRAQAGTCCRSRDPSTPPVDDFLVLRRYLHKSSPMVIHRDLKLENGETQQTKTVITEHSVRMRGSHTMRVGLLRGDMLTKVLCLSFFSLSCAHACCVSPLPTLSPNSAAWK